MNVANDNIDKMYEVWWESGDDDFLIAIFVEKEDAEDYLKNLNNLSDDYYIEEVEYE